MQPSTLSPYFQRLQLFFFFFCESGFGKIFEAPKMKEWTDFPPCWPVRPSSFVQHPRYFSGCLIDPSLFATAPPPLIFPAFRCSCFLPSVSGLNQECLGLARPVYDCFQLETESRLSSRLTSALPGKYIQKRDGTKSRPAQRKRINIFYLAKVKYLDTTIWSVGLEVTIAKYTVYVQSDGNPKFTKDTNLQ